MYLQEVLEVVIGVIFAWMLLSIAVLQIQEIIASYLEKRSSDLEMAIRDMLKDKKRVQEFYNHPLIQSLSKPTKLNANDEKKALELEKKDVLTLQEKRTLSKLRQRPSYIPASNFASAIMDIVIDAGTEKSIILSEVNKLRPTIDNLKGDDWEKANAIVDGICQIGKTAARSKGGSEFHHKVKVHIIEQINELETISTDMKYCEELGKISQDLKTLIVSNRYDLGMIFESDFVIDQLRVGSRALLMENPTLSRSINSLLEGVEQYAVGADKVLAAGRKNFENWFDSSMERLSGWYKRWAQVWAFFIGFAIALLFNVDSLYMAQQLWRNPATRLAAATYIEAYVETNAKNSVPEDIVLSAVQGDIQKLNFPVGWKLTNFPHEGRAYNCGLIDQDEKKAGIQTTCYLITNLPKDTWGYISKIFGCLITALAALQGAPFWFDTLKKIVNVRSTGINPIEKSKESAAAA